MIRTFVKSASRASGLLAPASVGFSRLAHERRMASLASAVRTADGRPVAPRVVSGPRAASLAFEHVEGVELVDVLASGAPDQQRRVARRLAAAVASLHTAAVPDDLPAAPTIVPVPLEIGPNALRELSSAAVAVYRAVSDEVTAPLWKAPVAPTKASFVHNDLRSVNVRITPAGEPMLVDWEFAGRGAPARDVGSVLADLVHHALRSAWSSRMPSSGAEDVEGVLLARLFLRAYGDASGGLPDAGATATELARALFHDAVARAQRDHRVHPVDRAAMGVVRRLATRPAALWDLVLGGAA